MRPIFHTVDGMQLLLPFLDYILHARLPQSISCRWIIMVLVRYLAPVDQFQDYRSSHAVNKEPITILDVSFGSLNLATPAAMPLNPADNYFTHKHLGFGEAAKDTRKRKQKSRNPPHRCITRPSWKATSTQAHIQSRQGSSQDARAERPRGHVPKTMKATMNY